MIWYPDSNYKHKFFSCKCVGKGEEYGNIYVEPYFFQLSDAF